MEQNDGPTRGTPERVRANHAPRVGDADSDTEDPVARETYST